MLTETEIYLRLKDFLPRNGWHILGGQPPGGTNAIPIIEMKEESHTAKGSKGSKKVDLIAYKRPFFLLIELKPHLSQSDIIKVREITSSVTWRRAFLRALSEKRVRPKNLNENDYLKNGDYLVRALGLNAGNGVGPSDFIIFLVSDDGVKIRFGREIRESVRELFTSF